jgi:signal transduction histidine kinase/DNA-binding response OmpR family regulator
VDPENILYAYKLEGFDQDWNYAQKQRVANYTNLPKGNYVFKVRSTNSEGVWADNERMLQIRVMPSFWETIWAYLIYLLIFGGIIYSIVRILFTIYRLRGNVEIEKKMAEMKLRFFTDISHEIRTPLTMISAPVDFMLNDSKTPEDIKKQLKTVSQNTNRMLRLVNQILDFRKIQFLHLKVREIEFAPFVEQICDSFSEIAENQHLRFRFSNRAANEKVWVDPDCLEKIVMNLLSNAFKYTAPGKTIHVTTKTDEKYVSVEVRDQGSGFARDKQKNLFVRFSSFNQDKSKPSTGIGLSIVKDLADKHNARISVESEEGKGSSFTVSFLKGIAHFDKNVEIIAADQLTENEHEINPRNLPEISENTRQLPEKHDGKHSVLIVEDDEDLRHFIADIIQDDYIVYQATDGKDGIEKALKYIPDFIVSDIMMPNVDGVELLQSLKSNINTSHIPIVLLTAKTTIESKLEGLTFGADDYITKPFSVPYFKARISNLISQRKHLQEIFRSELSKPDTGYNPQPYAITSQDEELMKKVMAIIEENMENTEFSVEELGLNMMMSRSVFFKKVKGLTGLAPVEFIRDVKMKRAAQILASGQYMVKEVSYLVGISDTKYFAKCFKAKYGVTPLEYKNQHQK